jgi:hypothetical protein
MAIIRSGVERNIPAESIEKMVAMVERQQDRDAERDYADALFKLQDECRRVVALKDVDGKFKYAPFLDIWKEVEGPLRRNHFTLQWDQRNAEGMVTKIATLQHLNGHKRQFQWTIRVGTNAPGTPAGAQAPVLDEQADSRAKRRLLLDVLNIVVDSTQDAAQVGTGETVTADKAEELFRRWANLSDNQKAFLDIAGVDSFAKIRVIDLPVLDRVIAAKERSVKRKGA